MTMYEALIAWTCIGVSVGLCGMVLVRRSGASGMVGSIVASTLGADALAGLVYRLDPYPTRVKLSFLFATLGAVGALLLLRAFWVPRTRHHGA